MKREELEKLSLPELCDLLAGSTISLLEFMEKKADGVILRDKKKEVELLQEIIKGRRAHRSA